MSAAKAGATRRGPKKLSSRPVDKASEYNALLDPNLRTFFTSATVQHALVHTGLIDEAGRIVNPVRHGGTRVHGAEASARRLEGAAADMARKEEELRRHVQYVKLRQLEEERRDKLVALMRAQARIREEINRLAHNLSVEGVDAGRSLSETRSRSVSPKGAGSRRSPAGRTAAHGPAGSISELGSIMEGESMLNPYDSALRRDRTGARTAGAVEASFFHSRLLSHDASLSVDGQESDAVMGSQEADAMASQRLDPRSGSAVSRTSSGVAPTLTPRALPLTMEGALASQRSSSSLAASEPVSSRVSRVEPDAWRSMTPNATVPGAFVSTPTAQPGGGAVMFADAGEQAKRLITAATLARLHEATSVLVSKPPSTPDLFDAGRESALSGRQSRGSAYPLSMAGRDSVLSMPVAAAGRDSALDFLEVWNALNDGSSARPHAPAARSHVASADHIALPGSAPSAPALPVVEQMQGSDDEVAAISARPHDDE